QSARGKQAGAAEYRLLGVSLVSRDGRRIVRRREYCAAHERAVREYQSRSRRAARPRSDLHERGADDDASRWLAHDRLSHARWRAVLWWHLLPAAGSLQHAGISPRADQRRGSVSRSPERNRRNRHFIAERTTPAQ